MSADAKVWQDEQGWHGIHDGPCTGEATHNGDAWDLVDLLGLIEDCMNEGEPMRWVLRVYPDGKAGLRGFCA